MDDKFTKEELVMLLAQRHQMEEADAEASCPQVKA